MKFFLKIFSIFVSFFFIADGCGPESQSESPGGAKNQAISNSKFDPGKSGEPLPQRNKLVLFKFFYENSNSKFQIQIFQIRARVEIFRGRRQIQGQNIFRRNSAKSSRLFCLGSKNLRSLVILEISSGRGIFFVKFRSGSEFRCFLLIFEQGGGGGC